MTLLLDTHVWLRWLAVGNSPLPPRLVRLVNEAEAVAVSAISIWEAAQLHRRGRIDLGMEWKEWLPLALGEADVAVLPVNEVIAARAAFLPEHHRDPADRLIIATAVESAMPLVSLDERFSSYRELDGLLSAK